MTLPKIIFLGTPEFALPSLRGLVESKRFTVEAVITQPDRPAGRGRKLSAPPVKELAGEIGITTYQPSSLNEAKVDASAEAMWQYLATASVDAFVVVAYGKLIPMTFMNRARCGAVNVHPSLLPRFRGAAPIQYALFSGDAVTGISLMKLDEGFDTGPVYSMREVKIEDGENYLMLHDRLAQIGAALLVELLPEILNGKLRPVAQSEKGVIYASKWEEDDLTIKWEEDAILTLRRVLASSPTPGARTTFSGEPVKILGAHGVPDKSYSKAAPGEIVEVNRVEVIVACGDGKFIALDKVQFAGGKILPIREVLKGRRIGVGEKFG